MLDRSKFASEHVQEALDGYGGGSFSMYTGEAITQVPSYLRGRWVFEYDIPVFIEGARYTLRLRPGE